MRLKEAQLLGILAIIAVLIIVLCMWGSGPESDAVATLKEGEATLPPEQQGPDTSSAQDLLHELEGLGGEQASEPLEGSEPTEGTGTFGIWGSGVRETQEGGVGAPPDPEPVPLPVAPDPKIDVAPPPPVKKDQAPPKVHVVKKGETLWDISRQYYGAPSMKKTKIIHDANKALIPNPSRDLRPDMRLVIPSLDETRVGSASGGRDQRSLLSGTGEPGKKSYVVQKNDTLWGIAQRLYGDPTAWKKILAANSGVLKKATDLKEDMRLTLP